MLLPQALQLGSLNLKFLVLQGEGLMNKPKYNLSFLPIFQEDLYEVTDYINSQKSRCSSPIA